MNNSKKIIVVSEAFFIVSGIEQLSFEVPGLTFDTSFNGNERNLLSKINDRKPDYILVDPQSIDGNVVSFLSSLSKNTPYNIIGIITNATLPKITGKFRHTLHIEDTKLELVKALKKYTGNTNTKSEDDNVLSKREKEILKNLALGKTNQEIADELFLSIHTVMTHRKKITAKLGIKTLSGLTVYAIMNNLVDIREIES